MTDRSRETAFRVARYLTGGLTAAENTQVEQELKADPALLEKLGVVDRLGRLLALADGTAPPADRTHWLQQRRTLVALAVVIALLFAALAGMTWSRGVALDRIELLEKQKADGFLAPPSTSRVAQLGDGRTAASLFRGSNPERVDLHIAAASLKYDLFRVAIVRGDGTWALHADRLARDSNGNLRIALNGSLLPAGRYQLQVEGFTWRGQTVPLRKYTLDVE